MIALVAAAFLVACGACFGLGWFARGEREADKTTRSAILALKALRAEATQEAQGHAAVAQDTANLAAGDNLEALLSEQVPK